MANCHVLKKIIVSENTSVADDIYIINETGTIHDDDVLISV